MAEETTLSNYETEDTQKDKYLTFHLAGEDYGIDIQYVIEIIGIQNITDGNVHCFDHSGIDRIVLRFSEFNPPFLTPFIGGFILFFVFFFQVFTRHPGAVNRVK